MELFAKLFSSLLVFVYHCFDRIVINGYLSGLSRPDQVVYFFRNVVGVPVVDKEALSKRTSDYRNWVEVFARNHKTPMEWAQKGVRKEEYVRPWLRRMEQAGEYGVYFIFQSMEQGPSFRCSQPKFPTQDPNHRILAQQRSRFIHYYFYLRDETLGPMVMRVATFFPFQTTFYVNGHSFIEQELNRAEIAFRKNDNAFLAVADVAALQAAADRLTGKVIGERLDYWTLLLGPKFSKRERDGMNLHRFCAVQQIEYCRNFIFKRHFPIHRIFERSCEIGLWRLTAHKISEIFGTRVTKKLKGKLNTTLEQIEHGHHIFRAYFKHAFVKQYEKFSTFLRNRRGRESAGGDQAVPIKDSYRYLSVSLAALTLTAFFAPLFVLSAQEAEFDAVVMKRAPDRIQYPALDMDPGYLTARAASLHFLLLQAFGLQEYELIDKSDSASWMKSEFYSIHAAAGKSASSSEMMAMLRGLLASRFHVVFHTETRELPVYALTVDPKGSKLPLLTAPQTIAELQNTIRGGNMVTRPVGSSIQEFVHFLNKWGGPTGLGLPVIDRTGLQSMYRIRLEFESIRNPYGKSGRFEIDYFTELPRQLGLRLQKTKAPVQLLIVDSAQRPVLDH